MYLLLGLSILLAMLLSFNSFATLVTSFLWRLIGKRALSWTPTARARTLFLLRVLPVTASLAVLMFLILPAYITYEPRSTDEIVGYKLGLIALASAAGIGLATYRGLASWRATSRLTSDWLTHARRISLAGVDIPCYQIHHQFPVVALVGIFRPRLFIASKVFEQLRPEELAGAIHHEVGHLMARDNLKRAFMRVCRDVLLIIPCGRMLDRQWSEASEAAADEQAALRGRDVALDLASALVKIARMIPVGLRPAMPAGVFLLGEDPGGIEARVSRLVRRAGNEIPTENWELWIPKSLLWFNALAAVSTFVLAATHTPTLASVHTLIEHTVYLLS